MILLGKTIPGDPCTNNGDTELHGLGFRFVGQQSYIFPGDLIPASPAASDHKVKVEGDINRVMVEGCLPMLDHFCLKRLNGPKDVRLSQSTKILIGVPKNLTIFACKI